MSYDLLPQYTQNQDQQKIQRIYIDPQYLIQLKKKRKSFKMVKSIFQPPQQHQDELKKSKISNNSPLKSHLSQNFTQINSLKSVSLALQQQSPNQKLENLYQILGKSNKDIHPNIEFIWKLLPTFCQKQILNFEQGDLIPLNINDQDRFQILQGQIRIIGINNHSYTMSQGYLFFSCNQTKLKIKQILVLRSTRLLRIPSPIYSTYLKNFIYLKNSQKIKYIKFCPFFIWNHDLTQDLASCIQIKQSQKQQTIYQCQSNPNGIYFVKEGIVLLERNNKVQNKAIEDYQMHYEKNQISQKDVILIVRKGMAFGLDGVIIKQTYKQNELSQQNFHNNDKKSIKQLPLSSKIQPHNLNQSSHILFSQSQHPYSQSHISLQNTQTLSKIHRKPTRIYTAKTLGKCQIYCLNKKVLQTLFSINDINTQYKIEKNKFSEEQLNRMSVEYTNLILNQGNGVGIRKNGNNNNIKNGKMVKLASLTLFNTSVKRKNLQLKIKNNNQIQSNNMQKYHKIIQQKYVKSKTLTQRYKEKVSKSINNHREKYNQVIEEELQIKRKIDNYNFIKKQSIPRIKKSLSLQKVSQNIKPNLNNQKTNHLPILINNNNSNTSSNNITTKNNIQKIIQYKIQQQINNHKKYNYENNNKIIIKQKQHSSDFNNNNINVNSNVNLNDSNSLNPVFINIKSYKSLITPYEK